MCKDRPVSICKKYSYVSCWTVKVASRWTRTSRIGLGPDAEAEDFENNFAKINYAQ